MEQENKFGELIEERRAPQKELLSTIRFLIVLLLVFAAFIYLFTQIFVGIQVIGSSMEPTLYEGDYLFINQTLLPERGDIIVIETDQKDTIHDETAQKWIIKRVIGLPGDTIKAENGVLFRKRAGSDSFVQLDESYLGEEWTVNNTIPETVVGEGMVYVLGDHRSISLDSRALGTLPLSDVMGVVTDWSLACKGVLTALFGIF